MDGIRGLTYRDIYYYTRFPGNELESWEIDLILKLDDVYMKVFGNG